MPGISSFPDFVLLFLRASARRCAPKLRRQKTSVGFDSIGGTRGPGPCLLSLSARYRERYNDCIMTIAVSIFICGQREAEPLRARLLISCLPIFLAFYFRCTFIEPPRARRAESHTSAGQPMHLLYSVPSLLSIYEWIITNLRKLIRSVDNSIIIK